MTPANVVEWVLGGGIVLIAAAVLARVAWEILAGMSEDPSDTVHFWPVGEIESLGQIIAELRIAGQRMEIQAGVMKEWSGRFCGLADALAACAKGE